MTKSQLDVPVTRRELFGQLVIVWLFIVLASLPAAGEPGWRSYVLPIGALIMLLFYAIASRRRSLDEKKAVT